MNLGVARYVRLLWRASTLTDALALVGFPILLFTQRDLVPHQMIEAGWDPRAVDWRGYFGIAVYYLPTALGAVARQPLQTVSHARALALVPAIRTDLVPGFLLATALTAGGFGIIWQLGDDAVPIAVGAPAAALLFLAGAAGFDGQGITNDAMFNFIAGLILWIVPILVAMTAPKTFAFLTDHAPLAALCLMAASVGLLIWLLRRSFPARHPEHDGDAWLRELMGNGEVREHWTATPSLGTEHPRWRDVLRGFRLEHSRDARLRMMFLHQGLFIFVVVMLGFSPDGPVELDQMLMVVMAVLLGDAFVLARRKRYLEPLAKPVSRYAQGRRAWMLSTVSFGILAACSLSIAILMSITAGGLHEALPVARAVGLSTVLLPFVLIPTITLCQRAKTSRRATFAPHQPDEEGETMAFHMAMLLALFAWFAVQATWAQIDDALPDGPLPAALIFGTITVVSAGTTAWTRRPARTSRPVVHSILLLLNLLIIALGVLTLPAWPQAFILAPIWVDLTVLITLSIFAIVWLRGWSIRFFSRIDLPAL